mmetsp:Transcript_14663/g.55480  ORF Transcript_14663/g.55480 Transcript_14663/m.55480 type:complete len:896 (+) Transcript_14663:4815-7502(+)
MGPRTPAKDLRELLGNVFRRVRAVHMGDHLDPGHARLVLADLVQRALQDEAHALRGEILRPVIAEEIERQRARKVRGGQEGEQGLHVRLGKAGPVDRELFLAVQHIGLVQRLQGLVEVDLERRIDGQLLNVDLLLEELGLVILVVFDHRHKEPIHTAQQASTDLHACCLQLGILALFPGEGVASHRDLDQGLHGLLGVVAVLLLGRLFLLFVLLALEVHLLRRHLELPVENQRVHRVVGGVHLPNVLVSAASVAGILIDVPVEAMVSELSALGVALDAQPLQNRDRGLEGDLRQRVHVAQRGEILLPVPGTAQPAAHLLRERLGVLDLFAALGAAPARPGILAALLALLLLPLLPLLLLLHPAGGQLADSVLLHDPHLVQHFVGEAEDWRELLELEVLADTERRAGLGGASRGAFLPRLLDADGRAEGRLRRGPTAGLEPLGAQQAPRIGIWNRPLQVLEVVQDVRPRDQEDWLRASQALQSLVQRHPIPRSDAEEVLRRSWGALRLAAERPQDRIQLVRLRNGQPRGGVEHAEDRHGGDHPPCVGLQHLEVPERLVTWIREVRDVIPAEHRAEQQVDASDGIQLAQGSAEHEGAHALVVAVRIRVGPVSLLVKRGELEHPREAVLHKGHERAARRLEALRVSLRQLVDHAEALLDHIQRLVVRLDGLPIVSQGQGHVDEGHFSAQHGVRRRHGTLELVGHLLIYHGELEALEEHLLRGGDARRVLALLEGLKLLLVARNRAFGTGFFQLLELLVNPLHGRVRLAHVLIVKRHVLLLAELGQPPCRGPAGDLQNPPVRFGQPRAAQGGLLLRLGLVRFFILQQMQVIRGSLQLRPPYPDCQSHLVLQTDRALSKEMKEQDAKPSCFGGLPFSCGERSPDVLVITIRAFALLDSIG